MASEWDPSIVQALTTLAGVLLPLERAASNSMEGTRGTELHRLWEKNYQISLLVEVASIRNRIWIVCLLGSG